MLNDPFVTVALKWTLIGVILGLAVGFALIWLSGR
jgi:hypothetical protein